MCNKEFINTKLLKKINDAIAIEYDRIHDDKNDYSQIRQELIDKIFKLFLYLLIFFLFTFFNSSSFFKELCSFNIICLSKKLLSIIIAFKFIISIIFFLYILNFMNEQVGLKIKEISDKKFEIELRNNKLAFLQALYLIMQDKE